MWYGIFVAISALQNQLVPLLQSLPDQDQSVYNLLKNLEQKVGAQNFIDLYLLSKAIHLSLIMKYFPVL